MSLAAVTSTGVADGFRPLATPAGRASSGVHLALVAMLISTILFQRVGFSGGGSEAPISFLVCLLCTGYLVFTGKVELQPVRLVGYLLVMSTMFATILVRGYEANLNSVGLVTLTYACWIFLLPMSREDYLRLLRFYQALIACLCIIGFIQFQVQFALGQEWMFPFDMILGEDFFLKNFMLKREVMAGTGIYKSNGLVFLEPSLFSQAIGWAVIFEILFFFRVRYFIAYAIGFSVAMSGTGGVLIGLCAPLAFIATRRWRWLMGVIIAAFCAAPFATQLGLDAFTSRTSEFSDNSSSAYARFIAPGRMLQDLVTPPFDATLYIGTGPGTYTEVAMEVPFELHDPPWARIPVEYGLLGSLSFSILFFAAFARRQPHWVIAVGAFIHYFFLMGNFLGFYYHVMMLPLAIWPSLRGDARQPLGPTVDPAAAPAIRRAPPAVPALPP